MPERSEVDRAVTGTDAADEDAATRLEAFAAQLTAGADEPAHEAARSRGWLDAGGNPTQEGRDLLKALDEQSQTRSALRNLP